MHLTIAVIVMVVHLRFCFTAYRFSERLTSARWGALEGHYCSISGRLSDGTRGMRCSFIICQLKQGTSGMYQLLRR